jgi:shikimate dehydrogenase
LRQSINGRTAVCGIIGWPVEHSLSPAIHNEAFRAVGLDWVYVPWAVGPDDVPRAVAGLRALGVRGFNVTVPHKERVASILDHLEEEARLIGAVNTVSLTDEGLTGHNTDVAGFKKSVENTVGERRFRSGIMFGCGGAGRAVLFGLCQLGVNTIRIADVDLSRADKLISEPWVSGFKKTVDIGICASGNSEQEDAVRSADLIVNATPVGMKQGDISIVPAEWIRKQHVVVDLVYREDDTPLVRAARSRGAVGFDGLGMLVEQAACSFEIWTNRSAPRKVMYKVVEEIKRGQAG